MRFVKKEIVYSNGDHKIESIFPIIPLKLQSNNGKERKVEVVWLETIWMLYKYENYTENKWIMVSNLRPNKELNIKELNNMFRSDNFEDRKLAFGIFMGKVK